MIKIKSEDRGLHCARLKQLYIRLEKVQGREGIYEMCYGWVTTIDELLKR